MRVNEESIFMGSVMGSAVVLESVLFMESIFSHAHKWKPEWLSGFIPHDHLWEVQGSSPVPRRKGVYQESKT